MILDKEKFLKRYACMSEKEEQSVLDRHPNANDIDEALDIEYAWYLDGLD